jgi:hypothetical protein
LPIETGFNFPSFNTSHGFIFFGSASFSKSRSAMIVVESTKGRYAPEVGLINPRSAGAIWYNTRQRVVGGYSATFRFQISASSRNCKTQEVISDRCTERGGDGFAFVLLGADAPALGEGGQGMGYMGLPNSRWLTCRLTAAGIAVEFDTWYNSDLLDLYVIKMSLLMMTVLGKSRRGANEGDETKLSKLEV